jgi:hypothetical protein
MANNIKVGNVEISFVLDMLPLARGFLIAGLAPGYQY